MRNRNKMRSQNQLQQHIGKNVLMLDPLPILRSTVVTVITVAVIFSCCLIQTTLAMPTAEFEVQQQYNVDPNFVAISEDVIPDVENTTQKVIRVIPIATPLIHDDPTDSSNSHLNKIKAKQLANRKYVNSKRLRRPRLLKPAMLKLSNAVGDGTPVPVDSPIIHLAPSVEDKLQKPTHQQAHKKKKLHFLYNQEALDGRIVGKRMRVNVAPGAYPVYYAVSKTNGRFGKYPIKGFNNEREFQKYLIKSKLEPIEQKERFES